MNKNILILLLAFSLANVYSQESFTLTEAIDYAIVNNTNVKNANLGIDNAKFKIRETTAIGLPQINAEGKFQNFLDIPVTVAPANAFNPLASPDDLVELKFGTEFNTTASITASQLLFSGSYIVGLQTSRTFAAVSEFQKTKSIQEVKESVMKAYYGVLVSQKTVNSMKEIAVTSEKIYNQTNALFKQGLIEEDNVTQLSLNVLTSKNSLRSAERQLENTKNVLKYQMGYDMSQDLTVSSDFESVVMSLDSAQSQINPDIKQNIDFKLLNKQLELGKLNVKYEKSQYLPTLSAFFTHQQQALRNDFDFFENKPWYPTTIWGLNLTVPIFSSGARNAKVAQAQISVKQTENSLAMLEAGLNLQIQSAKFNYNNAYDSYLTSKQAVDISRKIYTNYQIKFKEGLITSLDLSQVQTQYLSAETQYIQAMYGLISAKIELDKLTNKL